MKFTVAHAVALASLLLAFPARADWAQSSDPTVVTPRPAAGQAQLQNPPGFAWARHPAGPASYIVEIAGAAANAPILAEVDRNWYLPTQALAPGNYTWRVRPANAPDWSTPRPFSIDADAKLFEVADNASLRKRILQQARPRSLPPGFVQMADWSAAQRREMEPSYSRMRGEVERQRVALGVPSDASWPKKQDQVPAAEWADQQAAIARAIDEATRQLEAAAYLYRLVKGADPAADARYLAEVRRIGDALAGLDPQGPTSYANQDQATRQIALTLMKAVDIVGNDLGAASRQTWVRAVGQRTGAIYLVLAAQNGYMDQWPYDSHGATNAGYLSAIAALALGEIDAAPGWFDFAFRAYVNSMSPWSGPEGGFANGTAYAEYAAALFVPLWDPLHYMTGVNLYEKPWSVGFLEFAMQFTPPGARAHAFGDGAETEPDPRPFHAFATRLTSPRAAWYVNQLGDLEDWLVKLETPYPTPVSDTWFAYPPSNSSYFPGIGWASMHSDIDSPQRTSVYFKSSPYGSFNHSHADQNSFVLSVANQPLLISAGYYDWYGSPNWSDWYRQTRAQNAITFDGGIGQVMADYRDELAKNGKITRFSAQPGRDFVEGDASVAYGGALTRATRQLWYLRGEDAVLIRDTLLSAAAHTYEFNLHAPAGIMRENAASVRIAAGGQSVCVRSLGASAPFNERNGGAAAPNREEFHGYFALPAGAGKPAEFLVLLDVGCKRPTVSVSMQGQPAVRTVQVGSQKVELD